MNGDELRTAWRQAADLLARSLSPDAAVRAAARREAVAWQAELEAAPSPGRRLAAALRDAAARFS